MEEGLNQLLYTYGMQAVYVALEKKMAELAKKDESRLRFS